MKTFKVTVTEIERNVWHGEINAANKEEAYEIIEDLDRPWDEDNTTGNWRFDNFKSGLDDFIVDVVE